MSGLLIRGGDIVTADARWRGDIRCRDGRIVELGEVLEPATDEEILDADGRMIFPGGVDPHVHMSLSVAGTVSSDDFELDLSEFRAVALRSGSRAARNAGAHCRIRLSQRLQGLQPDPGAGASVGGLLGASPYQRLTSRPPAPG